jgi:hypothetical protein
VSTPLFSSRCCSSGFFGQSGQTCLACPIGAACPGYVAGIWRDEFGVVQAGRNYDPIPIAGFYNLNGTMASLCPSAVVIEGRDVCIVACSPSAACAGSNVCSDGYISIAPLFRCGSCAKGYYANNNECVRCPDSPALLFIGVAIIVLAGAAFGYFLNTKGINLAFLSIGVDFFQVLAMFADAQVAWPLALKQLWNIMSA